MAGFKKVAHFDPGSLSSLLTLVGFFEGDVNVSDIRWMAYMLATAYWETSHVESMSITTKNKKGKLITRKKKSWVNMKPVEETGHGAGRNYFLPVKVETQSSGDVQVTEQDGDTFVVKANGSFSKVTRGATMGAAAATVAAKAYLDSPGASFSYFGRGYVQLTWWSNYAKAGANLNKGLDFLLDPDKVMEPNTAYSIMAFSMRTGKGFANGHKLGDYFSATQSSYISARAMVNGSDHASDIAEIAKLFETVLYEARNI